VTVAFRHKDYQYNLKLNQLRDEVNRLQNAELTLTHQLRVARAEIEILKEERDSLQEQTVIDSLTKVRNRKGFDLALEHEVSQLPASGDSRAATAKSLGLMMVDVDLFKPVNDQHGHEMGDEVLVAIAHALKSSVRTYDEVCRWGGDEFVVILPGINELGLKKVAEQIRKAVADLQFGQIPNLQISVTIGGSIQLHQTDEYLLARSDAALYEAKNNGRDQVVLVWTT
jgi:diguanylate cyclase (GGDEF)-like protein